LRIGPKLAETLIKDGVAVALMRYRLAPADRHSVQADDVAAGIAHLIKPADKCGFDASEFFSPAIRRVATWLRRSRSIAATSLILRPIQCLIAFRL
jgi:hypothetical protein